MATVYKRSREKRLKGAKWIINWFDAESRKWRDKTGYTDKEASLKLGLRLELEAARRAEGCIDPLDEHRRRPIRDHLSDFVEKVRSNNRNSRYCLQIENRIKRVIEGIKAERLLDLDPVAIIRFLGGLVIIDRPISGITRNEYIGSLKAFTKWCVEARRIVTDPLASLKKTERKSISPVHPRRALTADEIARLLRATLDRPLVELQTIRHGPKRGERSAKVKPSVARRAIQLGRERRLAYLIAIWTGLRRSEIKQLQWKDLDLDLAIPRIRLRPETTKSNRADTLVIHPELGDELRAIRSSKTSQESAVVMTVPGMKVVKADLKFAGIEYGSRSVGYADLHAQRKTLSTMMAAAGMSQRTRQAHMRHTDPRLTENTYMDESLLPIASELALVPGVTVVSESKSLELFATGTTDMTPKASGNIQETCGPTCQLGPNHAIAEKTCKPKSDANLIDDDETQVVA